MNRAHRSINESLKDVKGNAEIVQKAWADLCMLSAPGSSDGMDRMNSAIAAGPPSQPSSEALKEMYKALADQGSYFANFYGGDGENAWEAVIGGITASPEAQKSDPEDCKYILSNYGNFNRWCIEVYQG